MKKNGSHGMHETPDEIMEENEKIRRRKETTRIMNRITVDNENTRGVQVETTGHTSTGAGYSPKHPTQVQDTTRWRAKRQ